MSGSGLSLPPWREHTVCAVCPSLLLALGEFDVAAKPDRESRYNPAVDYRVTPDGTGVCVHPDKLGLPPGRYASAAEPVPAPAWAGEQDPDPQPQQEPLRPAAVLPPPVSAPYTPPPAPSEDEAGGEWGPAHPAPVIPDELLALLRRQIAEAHPDDLSAVLARAESSARASWGAETVVEAMRRVLSGG
ncbi:hypothetical protein ACFV1L_22165 [Kitasatospora sp. NPDC059646]|uniref:hypothetical protein n=1 Tax=Kitasatospora sp. NPDC059646 TaxID=3346893 RepID=UPI0036BECE1E